MFPPLCPYSLPTLHSNGEHGRGHERGSNRATLQNRTILFRTLLKVNFFARIDFNLLQIVSIVILVRIGFQETIGVHIHDIP